VLSPVRRVWGELTAGFFFVPTVLVAVHIALAIVLTSTDLGMNRAWMLQWPHLFGAGADGARGMLSTIAASMMTVVGVTLSMTLVTLALASSQYTSRILRNFIGDRITQTVLGLFAGVYCYCLIVLRTIRGGDQGGFVPGLAVLAGVIMAVAGITVLIYFIHHIATSIQASNIIASVAAETISTIDRLYPADATPVMSEDTAVHVDTSTVWKPVTADKHGYVDRVDFPRLNELARTYRTMVRVERGMGEFVVSGSALLAVRRDTDSSEEMIQAFRRAIGVSRHRTLEQNVGYGIRQLVDIALRALSPGINDTTTAVMCIDYLTAIMAALATRRISGIEKSVVGASRVIESHPASFAEFLGDAFDQIREGGRTNLAVLQRLLEAIREIGSVPTSPIRRRLLLDSLLQLDESISLLQHPREMERLRSVSREARARLLDA
jgi:uncharacterized membrane protein